jgi:hypothetical protein
MEGIMESEKPNDNIAEEFRNLDIGGWSIFHQLFTRPPIQTGTFLRTYLIPWIMTAFLLYGIPLIVILVKVPEVLFSNPDGLKVGFLADYSVMFTALVSLPMLVILMLSERSMVPKRIAGIISGRVTYGVEQVGEFVSSWNKRYKIVNICGQSAGVLVALAVAFANYKIIFAPDTFTWQAKDGQANVAGLMYLFWQIPLVYILLSIYISQGVTSIFLLFSITRNFKIKLWPFHYDNCCGLKDVGYIGLRNQYLLAVGGLNLLALLVVNIKREESSTMQLFVAAFVAYITLGPVIFIGPLLPFRKSMLSAKQKEQAKVATQLQNEYTRIMHQLEERSMAKKDEEIIDRLLKLKELVNRIPVWPFDISTLKRFLTVYIFPILTAIVSILISYLIKAIEAMF